MASTDNKIEDKTDTSQETSKSTEENKLTEKSQDSEDKNVNEPAEDKPKETTAEKTDSKDEDEYTSPELEKYWKAVKENPADFTGWTYLLQYVEQEHRIEAAREAYDAFLARYPYCYGYWKKYTDLEKKQDNYDEAEAVFERGVKAIPLSIDLWIHYLNFLVVKYELPTLDLKKRQLFDRAITAAGTDFRSDKLWEMYITWEKDNGNMRNVCALYDRLIKIPTQLYRHQFDSFMQFIKEHHAKKILSLDEFLQIRREIVKPTTVGHPGEEPEENAPGEGGPPGVDDAPPGMEDEAPPGLEGAANEAENEAKKKAKEESEKLDEAELPAIREIIVKKRTEIFEHTEAEVSKRWAFEDKIRRPYFHVKPLEKAQLRNWRDYLDFEIAQGSHERVVVLFERCLIACTLYEEFWLKYADYMIAHSVDGVRNVFRRACQVHLPKKPSIHLAWAAFEEKQGKHEAVVEVFDKIDGEVPGLVMVSLRRISVERRQGNFQNTERLFQAFIDKAASKEEKAFFAIKYARYLAKVMGNFESAKAVLEKALESDPSNAKLLLQLVDLGYAGGRVDEQEMITYFDRGIRTNLAIEHRVAFSQRKMEFLEDFGSSITRLLQAYEDHQKLLKDMQSKKRKAAGEASGDSKKQKTGPAPTAIAASAVTSGATSVTAGNEYAQVSSTTDSAAYNAAAYAQQYGYNYQNYYGWQGYNQQGYYQT